MPFRPDRDQEGRNMIKGKTAAVLTLVERPLEIPKQPGIQKIGKKWKITFALSAQPL